MRRLGLAGAGLWALGPAARWSHPRARVAGAAVEVALTPVSRATLRLSVLPAGTASIASDGALVEGGGALADRIAPSSRERIEVGGFTIDLEADPLTVRVARTGSPRFQELVVGDAGGLTFGLGDGPLLGMGQGGPQFDRRGSTYRMRAGQGGFELRTHGSRAPIQWLVSTDGWALYVHRPLGTFDLTGDRGEFDPPEEDPLPLDLFVVRSDDPSEIMGEWARLTGHPEMPPLWSLGYQQSHRTLSGPEEVFWVAETMREKRLPCDTLIYLGTGFTPSGWNTQNGEFRWNPDVFPDPESMVERLHEMHYHVVLHAVLEGRRLTGTVADPCPDPPAPGETGSGRDWPREQAVSCYWPIHRAIMEQGVDGWWPDQGDGLDAASRLARIRMYYEGMQLYRPDQRPYALHRNGYAGMARYAPFLWSGDVQSRWETLRTHLSVAINTGLSGIPYWGTDIGGFVTTAEYTGELHVRWFQFGAFCPLFRAHGRTWHLRLPWGWNTGELGHDEVSSSAGAANPDPSELHNDQVEPICRKYLELRYRLMPYLYTAVRETHETGLPVMRSLWLHYPDDPLAAARGDEYLWGRDMLVAPVVERHATRRNLYLPDGLWYDWWTEAPVHGGREIDPEVDLETTPLYVRAGAVIPVGPVKQYTSEPVDEPLTLLVFPGADGVGRVYDDDGLSFGYRSGEWSRIRAEWSDGARRLTIRMDDGSPPLVGGARPLSIRVAGEPPARQLVFDGTPVEVEL